jgi:ribosome-associated protein
LERGKLPPPGRAKAVLSRPAGLGYLFELHSGEGSERGVHPGSRPAGGGRVHRLAPPVPRHRGGDVRESASFTDYFLLCSGTSDRQVTAVASHIEESLKKEGLRPLGVEGIREGRWVLIDYDDFVVHIFLDSVRDFYQFDRLWGSSPEIPIPHLP